VDPSAIFNAIEVDARSDWERRLYRRQISGLIKSPQVSEDVWNELARTLASQAAAIADIIQHEDGPQRKKKAEQAMTALPVMLNESLNSHRAAA
jgi:hypothetical protein